jgi:hypothetical protein
VNRDLSKTIESPRRYRLSNLPRSITVEQMLLIDRRSAVGKRDYAILLGLGALTADDTLLIYFSGLGRGTSIVPYNGNATENLMDIIGLGLIEMRREKATLLQTLASVLFAILVQLGILFAFRQTAGQLPGVNFSALAVIEMFFVMLLTLQFARLRKPAT